MSASLALGVLVAAFAAFVRFVRDFYFPERIPTMKSPSRPFISITTTARTWVWLTPLFLIWAIIGAAVIHARLTAPPPVVAAAAHQCRDQFYNTKGGDVVTCEPDQRLEPMNNYSTDMFCRCIRPDPKSMPCNFVRHHIVDGEVQTTTNTTSTCNGFDPALLPGSIVDVHVWDPGTLDVKNGKMVYPTASVGPVRPTNP